MYSTLSLTANTSSQSVAFSQNHLLWAQFPICLLNFNYQNAHIAHIIWRQNGLFVSTNKGQLSSIHTY